MPAEPRYRAAPEAMLDDVVLDALTAVFDHRSGQTHLLASPLPEMLEAMGEGDWTLAAFAAHLATHFDVSSEGGIVEEIIALRLSELVSLGLVEIA